MTRTFETFEEGDRAHLLADGVIQEVADNLGIPFIERGGDVRPGTYDALVRAVNPARLSGSSQLSVQETWTVAEAAYLVQRSGILEPLNRMLWTPEPPTDNVPVLLTGGTAHEQDRTGTLVAGLPATTVFVALRNRLMKTPQEKDHATVKEFIANNGAAPTEAQYFDAVIWPRLTEQHHVTIDRRYDMNGDVDQEGVTFLERFVLESEPEDSLTMRVAHVAGAGLELALKFRLATLEVYSDEVEPDLSVITDKPLFVPDQYLEESRKGTQNPYVDLERLARTAKLLHEATEAREKLG